MDGGGGGGQEMNAKTIILCRQKTSLIELTTCLPSIAHVFSMNLLLHYKIVCSRYIMGGLGVLSQEMLEKKQLRKHIFGWFQTIWYNKGLIYLTAE